MCSLEIWSGFGSYFTFCFVQVIDLQNHKLLKTLQAPTQMYVHALPISRPLAISPLHDQAKKPSADNFTLFTPLTNCFSGEISSNVNLKNMISTNVVWFPNLIKSSYE